MKILFDYAIFFHQKLGGVSRYFLNLKKFININKKIEAKIFAPFHTNKFLSNENNTFSFNFYIDNYPNYSRRILNILNHNLSKVYCKFFRPNIIHKTFYNKDFNFDSNIKKVITVYDLIHEIYYNEYHQPKGYLPKKESLSNVDFIICPSIKTKSDLIHYYNIKEEKIKVIYMGVHQFEKVEAINFNKDYSPFILYVGERKRYKNFLNLLKAISIKKNINNDFKLICFGGGSLTKNEQEIIADLKIDVNKIIQVEGDDSDLYHYYKKATAFVFPSKYEGLGLPQLEAMSLGCPVISSNHEAIIESVGNAAAIFDPNKPEDIAETLNNYLYSSEKLNSLKSKGLARSKLFSLEKCALETVAVYKNLFN
jgi:glycosyltransferase involved in cell wall biosynthesis